MRTTIFSRESGIQFITLFSLVIAIILFGILEILHDKELAALLGGLSGYILGRVSDRASGGSTAAATPQPTSVTRNTISFTAPNIISDSGNGLAVFSAGQRIRISGAANNANNSVFTTVSVSANQIQTVENTIVSEAAGNSVQILAV
jgi:hypothetical protein